MARQAILNLHLHPVMFDTGARPHPPRELYSCYLAQSHVFVAIYWKSYGWVAPGMRVSGLEDEYDLSEGKPRLIYIKDVSAERDPALNALIARITDDNRCSYAYFTTSADLGERLTSDLAVLLSEQFQAGVWSTTSSTQLPIDEGARLPAPPTPLIGRKRELEQAARFLCRDDVSLLTVSGPGGSGKTRLAIQIAADLHESFPDGVYFVGFESINDPGLVVPTIAHRLGLSDRAVGQAPDEILARQLRGRRVLLLLDNLEHVLSAAPQIAALLTSCPDMKILATSRAPLRLRAEKVLAVPPLELPPPGARLALSELEDYAAIRLFVERVRAATPAFRLTEEQAPTVAEICRRLEGLPLAIELAAARSKFLSPSELLARLEHRLEVLRGGSRDLPERQQTMAGTIDWSYSLLRDEEKELLRRLSVFAGGWSLEGACRVTGTDEVELIPRLEGLVDNSLVNWSIAPDGTSRFTMLEIIRQFALDRLESKGEAPAAYRAHASYFLALAATLGRKPQSAQQSSYESLERDLDNFRTALAWALDGECPETGLRAATELWWFWEGHGYWRENLEWFDRGLAAGEAIPAQLRATALMRKAWLIRPRGDYAQVTELCEESLALFRELGDEAGVARTLTVLGVCAMREADYKKATTLFEETLRIWRRLGDSSGTYTSLLDLGSSEAEQGHYERAVELHSESLALSRQAGDDTQTAMALINLGELMAGRGELDGAENYLAEAVSIFERDGNHALMALASHNRAYVAYRRHEPERALALVVEVVEILAELGDVEYGIPSLEILARVLADLKQPGSAARLLAAARSLRTRFATARPPVYWDDQEASPAAVRAELGEAEFTAAWRDGAAMDFDQAVAFALQEAKHVQSRRS